MFRLTLTAEADDSAKWSTLLAVLSESPSGALNN